MRILYFINGFDPGGAEHGLLTLVESGFFSGHELDIAGMCRGRGDLAETLRRAVGEQRFHIAGEREKCENELKMLRVSGYVATLRGGISTIDVRRKLSGSRKVGFSPCNPPFGRLAGQHK